MLMGCGSLSSATVWLNTPLRRLLPPNVNPKTQERWQPPPVPLTGVSTACPSLPRASLLVQMVGHDVLAMYVLGPGCTVHLPQTALCCGVSGRPCCKPNLPREPVTEVPIHASQKLPLPMTLCFSRVGLTYSEPEDDLYEQFEFSLFLARLSVLNEYEYDNIRPCRKVLIMLFGVMLSSMIIFDLAAPSWPWISHQTVRYTSLFRVLRVLLLLIKAVQPEYIDNENTFAFTAFICLNMCPIHVPLLLLEHQTCAHLRDPLITQREVRKREGDPPQSHNLDFYDSSMSLLMCLWEIWGIEKMHQGWISYK